MLSTSKKPDRSLNKGFLPIRDSFVRRGEIGIRVVDGESEAFKLEISAKETPRLVMSTDASKKGWGQIVSANVQGTLVMERVRSSYQHSGIEGSFVGN